MVLPSAGVIRVIEHDFGFNLPIRAMQGSTIKTHAVQGSTWFRFGRTQERSGAFLISVNVPIHALQGSTL